MSTSHFFPLSRSNHAKTLQFSVIVILLCVLCASVFNLFAFEDWVASDTLAMFSSIFVGSLFLKHLANHPELKFQVR